MMVAKKGKCTIRCNLHIKSPVRDPNSPHKPHEAIFRITKPGQPMQPQASHEPHLEGVQSIEVARYE